MSPARMVLVFDRHVPGPRALFFSTLPEPGRPGGAAPRSVRLRLGERFHVLYTTVHSDSGGQIGPAGESY